MVTFSVVRKQYKRRLTGNIRKALRLLIHTCGPESLGCKTSSVPKDETKGEFCSREMISQAQRN